MIKNSIINLSREYEDYLKDESRRIGEAESISFPKSSEEIKETLLELEKLGTEVTIQGARTGLAAGAVPQGGHVLNLSRMKRVLGLRFDKEQSCFYLLLEPGVLLSELREALINKSFQTINWSRASLEALDLLKAKGKYFFPPDPTETSASIGGMVSCNASGACSYKYGPTRKFIEGLNIILINGSSLRIKRGEQYLKGRSFHIKSEKPLEDITGEVPSYKMPRVKNASGFYAEKDMDLIDLFIGAEGTLGIVTEIEIKLIPEPECKYGMTAFFSCEAAAIKFIRGIRDEKNIMESSRDNLAAIEYFNSKALKLLKERKTSNSAFTGLLEIKPRYNTAVYIEFHGNKKETVLSMLMNSAEIMVSCGGKENDTWVAMNPSNMEKLHAFRHATPEAVNLLIDSRRKNCPGITKLSTDMAVPGDYLEEVLNMYNSSLLTSNLEAVMFGHIGNNHIHVNIIPSSMEDYKAGKELYNNWAKRIIRMGGTVSAEHGIGKLKTQFLLEMFGEKGIAQMKALKALFDPAMRLNRGNLFL
jgi:D-lactate dehydrogenase (cytochrome)